MYKFFINVKQNDCFILKEAQQRHLKVLRIKKENILINYQNEFYECEYIFPNKAKIIKKLDINNEINLNIIAAIPLIKKEHFEFALQKTTELGVNEIIPFVSEYTDKSNLNVMQNKSRLEKIILEASQQSFRNKIPKLLPLHTFNQILDYPYQKIIAYEKQDKSEKFDNLSFEKTLICIVGPEGGFNFNEIKKALEKNAKIVALTKSILRSETALIYMLSKINK